MWLLWPHLCSVTGCFGWLERLNFCTNSGLHSRHEPELWPGRLCVPALRVLRAYIEGEEFLTAEHVLQHLMLLVDSACLCCLCCLLQPPEPTPIQTFHDEGFVPPPTPEAAFTHK